MEGTWDRATCMRVLGGLIVWVCARASMVCAWLSRSLTRLCSSNPELPGNEIAWHWAVDIFDSDVRLENRLTIHPRSSKVCYRVCELLGRRDLDYIGIA